MCSKVCHIYDGEMALEVLAGIPSFLEGVQYPRDKLKEWSLWV